MRKLLILSLLLCSLPLHAQTISSDNLGGYNYQALPGETIRLQATITGGTTNLVNASVTGTGGATGTLSCTTNCNPWNFLTVGGTAGTCGLSPASGSGTGVTYTTSSTATLTVTMTSTEGTNPSTTFIVDVCAKTTTVYITPFYITLYSGQKEDFQSWVWGNTNGNVTWAITAQPADGDGTLVDTNQRDAVFSATVAGEYTLTATSVDGGTKSEIATIYVTGHSLPYAQTPEKTEPVDCTADPALTGTVYEVGPTQTYSTITAAMNAINTGNLWTGSTIRVHNEDTTGLSPTVYNEYLQVNGSGTRTEPFRICGVPDSLGNLPIIDASNATGASWVSTFGAVPFGVLSLHVNTAGPEYIIIEGLHIRNGYTGFNYTPPGGGAQVAWQTYTEGINDRDGGYHVLRGNDVDSNGTGIFTEFNGNNTGWAANKLGVDIEGNSVHGNGNNNTNHQMYLQGWMELVQFNYIGAGRTGAGSYSQIKCRDVDSIFRYNYVADSGQSGGRMIDCVDNEDSSNWVFPYVANAGFGYVSEWANGDTHGLDWAAANLEAWHHLFMYGNVLQDTSDGQYAIHDMGDHEFAYQDRQGGMEFYDNTIEAYADIFDMDDGGATTPAEYPWIDAQNNVLWDTSASGGCWNRNASAIFNFTTNQVNTGLANFTTPIPTAWTCNAPNTYTGSAGNVTLFTNGAPINNHFTGWSAANIASVATQPFDSNFNPITADVMSGTALSGQMANMPVRFQFGPATGAYYVSRQTPVTSTSGGIVGAMDNYAQTTSGNAAPQLLLLQ